MKPCCRDCQYFVLGYNKTTQINPSYVCNRREKRIYRGDYNGVRGRKYFFAAVPTHCCGLFKKRETDGNKKV